ncbi:MULTISPECIES: hypothetical protein [Snodgrassella]|nr:MULTISPECIES: hypothetical protein [Snodgrassella]MCO6526545.1 hypothetical protein [Snodgrassella sp.]
MNLTSLTISKWMILCISASQIGSQGVLLIICMFQTNGIAGLVCWGELF